jgi:hypothetical protein
VRVEEKLTTEEIKDEILSSHRQRGKYGLALFSKILGNRYVGEITEEY